MRKKLLSKLMLLLCALLVGSTSAWAGDVVVTLENIGTGLTSTANTTAATTDIIAAGTEDTYTLNYYQCKKQGSAMLMTKSVSPYISNKTEMPGNIKSVEVFINSGASGKTTYDCAFSTTECTSAVSGIGAVNITGGNSNAFSNLDNGNIVVEGKYFCITLGNANNGQVLKLVITCEGSTAPASHLASIAVDASDATTVFHVGDEFTTEGAVVTATYDDESTKDVTASATFSTPDMTTAGSKTVTVTYTENEVEKETSYDITVLAPATLSSITLSGTYPIEFTQGDEFSSEGIVVTANYDDDTQKDVTGEATFSGYDMSATGEQTVTVSYGGKTATYSITVNEYVMPSELTVDFESDLSTYKEWKFENIGTTNTAITAHGGSKYGANINDSGNGVATCSIKTMSKVNPETLTFYVSKCSNNSTASSWYVEVSEDGSEWTQVGDAASAASMSKDTWNEVTRDLSAYSDVYVRIRYGSSSAIRAIDDITLELVTPKVLSSIALSGEYPTTFYTGDTFSYDGMTVTATYDTGKTKDVTAKATFTGYDMANAGNQTVTVSYTENEVTKTAEYNITVKAPATLESIALSGDYPNTFIVGDEFSSTGLVVTATLSDDSQVEVTDDAAITGYDMNADGEQTVTVSYTYKEVTKQATYQITVNPIPVKTIAEFIAAGGGKCYLIGTISNDKENKYGNYDLTDASGTIYVYGTLTAEGIAQQYKTMGIGDGDKVKVLAETYEYYNNTTHEAKNVRFIKKIVDVTISDALYATYVTASDVSFPDEVTAYVPTSVNGEYVHLEEILDAPKGTPVIVKADAAGTYELELDYAEVSDNVIANNLLKVSDGTITTTDATTVYALANKPTNGVGFYRVKKDAENPVYVPAGKAYLEVATSNDVREFLAFTEGETDGIRSIDNGQWTMDNAVYSLSGQRVQKAQKGIYIVNGKKIMVK